MGLSGYLSSGAELGNMTGKAILSLLGTLIEEVGIFARGVFHHGLNVGVAFRVGECFFVNVGCVDRRFGR